MHNKEMGARLHVQLLTRKRGDPSKHPSQHTGTALPIEQAITYRDSHHCLYNVHPVLHQARLCEAVCWSVLQHTVGKQALAGARLNIEPLGVPVSGEAWDHTQAEGDGPQVVAKTSA